MPAGPLCRRRCWRPKSELVHPRVSRPPQGTLSLNQWHHRGSRDPGHLVTRAGNAIPSFHPQHRLVPLPITTESRHSAFPAFPSCFLLHPRCPDPNADRHHLLRGGPNSCPVGLSASIVSPLILWSALQPDATVSPLSITPAPAYAHLSFRCASSRKPFLNPAGRMGFSSLLLGLSELISVNPLPFLSPSGGYKVFVSGILSSQF